MLCGFNRRRRETVGKVVGFIHGLFYALHISVRGFFRLAPKSAECGVCTGGAELCIDSLMRITGISIANFYFALQSENVGIFGAFFIWIEGAASNPFSEF